MVAGTVVCLAAGVVMIGKAKAERVRGEVGWCAGRASECLRWVARWSRPFALDAADFSLGGVEVVGRAWPVCCRRAVLLARA